jgi:NAD/NADP transhydrogenase alpha subunit
VTAATGAVVRRALGYAVVVGALLIVINHGDAIVAGRVDAARVIKMVLTLLVPYCVSTASSVGAILAQRPCDEGPVTAQHGDRTP